MKCLIQNLASELFSGSAVFSAQIRVRWIEKNKQGGQIGRILPIVYFGQSFENYKSSPNGWASLIRG
jgi:hypothetical protein